MFGRVRGKGEGEGDGVFDVASLLSGLKNGSNNM